MFEQFGIHQGTAEVLILACIAVAACGVILMLFWKYIAAGLVAVFCLYTFAQHIPEQPAKEVAKAVAPVETVIVSDAKKLLINPKDDFMYDCLSVADYNKEQCEEHWKDRQSEEFQIKHGKDEQWVTNR
jgi:hypothetical protein